MGRKSNQLTLDVFINGVSVGKLSRASSGALEFLYSRSWLESYQTFPISQSLPLREEPYRDQKVAFFFDNLLPDNEEIRRRIAQRLALDGTKTMDLLAALGPDCVGALQFLPQGSSLEEQAPIKGEPMSPRKIANILRNFKTSPLGLDQGKEFRISLAGVQEKTALLRWNSRWFLPSTSTPTTHILKPAIGKMPNGIDMSGSVPNEWMCLKIAKYFGLSTAEARIARFDGVDCLVVERFDRKWLEDGKRILRIPQEDLCQAMGVPWSQKYESDGGPGIRECMDFLNASDERIIDRIQFMKAQVIFFLLGATDGHAKNFSIRPLSSGFRLTPLYDIMTVLEAISLRQIEPKQAKLAMSVGEGRHRTLHTIQRRHWFQTAKQCSFPEREMAALLDEITDQAEGLETFLHGLRRHVPMKLMQSVLNGVQKRLSQIKKNS